MTEKILLKDALYKAMNAHANDMRPEELVAWVNMTYDLHCTVNNACTRLPEMVGDPRYPGVHGKTYKNVTNNGTHKRWGVASINQEVQLALF